MPSRSRSAAHSKSPHSKSPSSSSASGSEEDMLTVASLRKRKRGSGKKGHSRRKKHRDEYEVYRHFAHWYLRSAHAFVDYGGVLAYGIRWQAKQYGKISRERFAEKFVTELDTFFAMRECIASFDDELPKLMKDPERLNNIAKLMNDAAGSARGNDIKSLLDRGLVYLALDLPGHKLEPTISAASTKDQTRGHHHVVLSRLLTPVRLLKDFDKDPEEYRKKILRGDIKFNDQDFPSLLYHQPDGFDPDDLEANLLQNQTVVRFFKHLFTSPSSATRDAGTKPKRRTGQAKINQMTEVTPASIAYAFMMFWYNISAINDWRTDDDLTDRLEFYNMILWLFDEHEDDDRSAVQWRNDILNWWNFQVFGTVPEKSDDESDNQPTTTTLQLLREQRAQKSAAAAAAAASASAAEEAAAEEEEAVAEEEEEAVAEEEAAATSESGGTSITLNSSSLRSTTLTDSSLSLELASRTSDPLPSVQPSSPLALALARRSRSFSPARHTNTNTEKSPAPRPVKFTRNKFFLLPVSESSKNRRNRL